MQTHGVFLTAAQISTVLETLRKFGLRAKAAKEAGTTASVLNRELLENEDFRIQVEDAEAEFKDNVQLVLLERATVGRRDSEGNVVAPPSDQLLIKLAEATAPEKYRAAPVDNKTRGKPTGLRLRSFGDEEGDEPASETPAAAPIKPLTITFNTTFEEIKL